MVFVSPIYGQSESEAPTIISERPGISDSPYLVPMYALQVASGFNYDYQNNLIVSNKRLTYNFILLR